MLAIHNLELATKNNQAKVEVEESMEGFLARLFTKSIILHRIKFRDRGQQ
ncbi:MAG: hypothetical protein ABFD61_07485 [Chloroherpetonaceae bacterium]